MTALTKEGAQGFADAIAVLTAIRIQDAVIDEDTSEPEMELTAVFGDITSSRTRMVLCIGAMASLLIHSFDAATIDKMRDRWVREWLAAVEATS